MMHGHEKSDPAIVAVKPTNKAKEAPAEASAEAVAAELVERRAGAKGNARQHKHVLGSEPGKRDTGRWRAYGNYCRHIPEVGAVCGKAARTDLGGGREETRVPTATRHKL